MPNFVGTFRASTEAFENIKKAIEVRRRVQDTLIGDRAAADLMKTQTDRKIAGTERITKRSRRRR